MLGKEIKKFWSNKYFAAAIPLMMVLSYITLLLHPTVGIDDTAFKVYFIDGVAPAMGRWCLYLIHKIFPLAYNPFYVEAVGLLIFCLSVTLWCVVFRRLFGERISIWGYILFGGVMLSSPILSEIVVWYLQNGLYIGYGVTALSVLCAMDALHNGMSKSTGKRMGKLLLSAAALTVALGFYESLMIVFLMAALMVFLLVRVLKPEGYDRKPLHWLSAFLFITAAAVALRTVIVKLITVLFHLESQKDILKSRGLYEVLGWFDGTRSPEDFVTVMKEFLVKYALNGVVYLPVTILVIAVFLLISWGIYRTVRNRDGWILAATAGILIVPWVMPVLEGVATYYRAAQFVPLLTAFMVLPLVWELGRIKGGTGRVIRYAGVFAAGLLLYRQGYEMNKWLYVDAMKYEDNKRTLEAVGMEIRQTCDLRKPVCVIGHYETPKSLIADVYCPPWSKKYQMISTLVRGVDEKIFEAGNFPEGYAAAETPRLSFPDWGATAFYQFDRELIKFWNMHGFSFQEDGNLGHYEEARELMKNGPVWPQEGSVVEKEEYIIVNFGNF